jgi:5'-nucleotidase
MPLDLSDTLVVGITTTALFDMSEPDHAFQKKFLSDPESAVAEYRAYALEHENEPLMDGTGMPLVMAILALNKYQKQGEPPLVEVVIMSRNSPETGIRVFNNIRSKGIGISRLDAHTI